MTEGTENVVDRLRAALAARRDVHVAVLFGSVARGVHGPGSDVDVAVLAPGVDLLALAADLGAALGRDVDVVSLVDAPIPLLEEVLRDGIVVHEARRGAAAQWRASMLGQLETDRPGYARMRDAFLRRVAARGLLHGER